MNPGSKGRAPAVATITDPTVAMFWANDKREVAERQIARGDLANAARSLGHARAYLTKAIELLRQAVRLAA
jgi:hypothetical protein